MYTITGKYTSAFVTNDSIEQEAIEQIYGNVNCRAYKGQKIVIQPDSHCGKGSVIGFCSTVGNHINPCTVGVDIGCTISMNLYNKPIPEDKYAEFNHKILKEIGWGFNTSPKKVYEDKEMYKFMSTEFRKAKSKHPDIFDDLPDTVTEKWIDEFLKRIGMDARTFYYSINSVGGGNHYVEYDVNEEAGLYGVTVHCGSRNLGVKVCKYWENKAKGGALPKSKIKELTNKFKTEYKNSNSDMRNFESALKAYLFEQTKDHIEGFLMGENMNGYFCDMLVAMTYAKFNHLMLHKTIDNILLKYGCKKVRDIISVHNYVDFNEDVPVIRKGAIRSYKGEEMLVPFNMRDGVAICEGKSNEEWLNSCAHGAGRKMSRAKAKSNLSMDEFESTMKNVYSTTVCKGTIDEAPMAYKDTNEIVELIKNTCDVKYMLIPKINIKAVDGAE